MQQGARGALPDIYPPCKVWGKENHPQSECLHKAKECGNCGKVGHLALVCKAAAAPAAAAKKNDLKAVTNIDDHWPCLECNVENTSGIRCSVGGCKGRKQPGQGAAKPPARVPPVHSKGAVKILKPEDDEMAEDIPQAVQLEIAELEKAIIQATEQGWEDLLQMHTAKLEKLRPETKVETKKEAAKALRTVATDLQSIEGRYETKVTQLGEAIKTESTKVGD